MHLLAFSRTLDARDGMKSSNRIGEGFVFGNAGVEVARVSDNGRVEIFVLDHRDEEADVHQHERDQKTERDNKPDACAP
jgi:hypothetical protein